MQSGPLGTLRIHVVFDNSTGSSVQGAGISGSVSIACGVEPPPSFTISKTPIETVVTPINGTITNLKPREDGNYSLTVTYLKSSYTINAATYPEEITWVTLGIPSGKVNVTTVECYPQFMTICGYVSG